MEATKQNAQQPKPQAPVAKKANNGVSSNVGGIKNAFIVILISFVIAECFYLFGLGSFFEYSDGNTYASHFFAPTKDEGVTSNPTNLLGTMYLGGFVVPFILTCLLTVLTLTVERFIALGKAAGKGNQTKFVAEVKKALNEKNVAKAEELCKKQQGTVGAIVFSTLGKYKEMEANTVLPKEQKLAVIQQQLEEATALEMPSLQQNLPILATMTTLGTLLGLFGTVVGMIMSSIVVTLMFKYFVEVGIPYLIKVVTRADSLPMSWLANVETRYWTLLFYGMWAGFGGSIILYTGAMCRIPDSIIEYGRLDGLTIWQEFWHITLPLIYPTLTTMLVVSVSGFFTSQLSAYNFYGGNAPPGISTLGYYFFVQVVGGASSSVDYPYASAMGLIFTGVAAPVTLLVKYLLEHFGPNTEF